MRMSTIRLGLLVLLTSFPCFVRAQEKEQAPPKVPDWKALGVEPTQLTLVLDEKNLESRFRASVLASQDNRLTVLTAAHALAAKDQGQVIHLRQGQQSIDARVVEVIQNPDYTVSPYHDSPGADNAVARLQVLSEGEEAKSFLDGLRIVKVTPWPIPDRLGQTVGIVTQDQFGKFHLVRAANFSNPFWLEWGPSYRPIPGDSGGGVFTVIKGKDGALQTILIGVVVVRSEVGGGASVVSRRYPWLDKAVEPAAPKETP